jgi:hypothetical protein
MTMPRAKKGPAPEPPSSPRAEERTTPLSSSNGVPLATVLEQLDRALYTPPAHLDSSLAVLNDALRDLGLQPLLLADFDRIGALAPTATPLLAALAFALRSTGLGEALRAHAPSQVRTLDAMRAFLSSCEELPADTLPKSAFRREELLRKWLAAVELPIAGESPSQSAQRLEQVDFNRLKRAMDREAQERKRLAAEWVEKKAREEAEEAARRAAQPSGSYE